MRQLVFVEPGKLEWREVPAPRLGALGQALVRPLAVARCDIDPLILRGATPVRGPFAFGHECVGEIVDLSDDVRSLETGDRVVVSFEIACGACERCQRGETSTCLSAGPKPAMYGLRALGGEDWGGALSDLLRVPFARSMLVPLPEGADPVTYASAGDNVCDGWRTVVPQLRSRPGAPVLVVGGGAQSIGLYAVDAARATSDAPVVYLDQDPARLAIAESLGAESIEGDYEPPGSYPITVDASARPEGLRCALQSLEEGGICTSVGIYYKDVPIPLLQMYVGGATFQTGRCNACHHLPDVVAAIAGEQLHPDTVRSRIATFAEAVDAMDDPGPKLVLVP